jgi:hypothetical protein
MLKKKQTPKGESDNYGDGGVDVTGAPNAALVEGANDAFSNRVFSSEQTSFLEL